MIRDTVVGFAPFWYPVAAAAGLFVVAQLRRFGGRRLARARRSLSEHEITRSGRPSPAPIDVGVDALVPQPPRSDGPRHTWRRSEQVVLIACVFFAAFEVAVLVVLERIVEGALA